MCINQFLCYFSITILSKHNIPAGIPVSNGVGQTYDNKLKESKCAIPLEKGQVECIVYAFKYLALMFIWWCLNLTETFFIHNK